MKINQLKRQHPILFQLNSCTSYFGNIEKRNDILSQGKEGCALISYHSIANTTYAKGKSYSKLSCKR